MRLIDADTLKNELCEGCSGDCIRACTRDCYEVQLIKAQPTIEAEPVRRGKWLTEYGDYIHVRRGKWKILDDTEFRAPGWYCSLCNYQISDRYGKYKFCPNCGAQMEE